jgi:uncharacterized GH25 family protein
MLKAVVGFCLAFAAWGAPRAHDFWIEPSSFRPALEAPVSAKLRVGTDFQGEVVPRDEALLVRFILQGPAEERPLAGRDGADPAGYARIGGAGLYLIGYQSRASAADLDAAKIAQYTKEEGLEPFLKLTPQEKAAGIRDHYARCAKALLAAGNAGPDAKGFDRKLGLPLELIPETNPHALAAGRPLPIRLLREGKPLQGVLVTAIRRDAPDRRVGARTDAAGRVALPLEGSGVWLVKAVHATRGKEPRDWNSLWASLILEVP